MDVKQQDRDDAHLFSPVGLLDDAWHHRSYWTYGVTAVYGWHVWVEPAKYAPSGRILSFDDEVIYGFARKPQFIAQSPTIEYQLYKADRRPAADGPARVQRTASEHREYEWNQTQGLSRGRLYRPHHLRSGGTRWLHQRPAAVATEHSHAMDHVGDTQPQEKQRYEKDQVPVVGPVE